MSILELLDPCGLEVYVLLVSIVKENTVFRLEFVGDVEQDSDKELVHGDPVHSIVRVANRVNIVLRLGLSRHIDAKVH